MYIEILIVIIVIGFILVYNNVISTNRFFDENSKVFLAIKEKDYDFLLRAKYGEKVYDTNEVFMRRIRKAIMVTFLFLFIFIYYSFKI